MRDLVEVFSLCLVGSWGIYRENNSREGNWGTSRAWAHPLDVCSREQKRRRKPARSSTRSTFTKPANIQQLWSLIPAEKRDEYLTNTNKDVVPVLDLLPLGYSKVLGKGRLPEVPLVVRARWFSKEAERKITEAGGVVELVA